MPWLSEALQGVSRRGGDIREKVREHARTIAQKAQQLEEAAVSNLRPSQLQVVTAREEETKLEWDAHRLEQLRPQQAAELVQQWLDQMQGSSRRFIDAGGLGTPKQADRRELTFIQVFLRSRALEIALDSATRAAELRSALCSRMLPLPSTWPDDPPPDAAFARAFAELLLLTIGPSESWLPALGVLLASEGMQSNEQCRSWVVSLIGGQRLSWEAAASFAQELDVKVAEEAAVSQSMAATVTEEKPLTDLTSDNLMAGLEQITRKGQAFQAACHALQLRSSLAIDLASAARQEEELGQARSSASAALAAAASELAASSSATLQEASSAAPSEAEQASARASERLQPQMEQLDATAQEIQREIENAEQTQKELLRQVGKLSEKLDVLRQRQAEKQRVRKRLEAELTKAQQDIEGRKAAETEAREQADQLRAMALTVATLAEGQRTSPALRSDKGSPAGRLLEKAAESRRLAATTATALAEEEVVRLRVLAQALSLCAARCKKSALSKGAAPAVASPDAASATGRDEQISEPARSLQAVLLEFDRSQPLVAGLVSELKKQEVESDGPNSSESSSSCAGSKTLREGLEQALQACESARGAIPAETLEFIASLPQPQLQQSLESGQERAVARSFKALLGRWGSQVPMAASGILTGTESEDLDPFLLRAASPPASAASAFLTPVTSPVRERRPSRTVAPGKDEGVQQKKSPETQAAATAAASASASGGAAPAAEAPAATAPTATAAPVGPPADNSVAHPKSEDSHRKDSESAAQAAAAAPEGGGSSCASAPDVHSTAASAPPVEQATKSAEVGSVARSKSPSNAGNVVTEATGPGPTSSLPRVGDDVLASLDVKLHVAEEAE